MGRQMRSSRGEDERSLREARAPAEAAWRGIAIGLFFIVPIISWAAASVLLDYGIDAGWPLPPEMVGSVRFPPEAYGIPGLSAIVSWLSSQAGLLGKVVLTILFIVFLGGLLSSVYSVFYRMNVPRYGRFDAPPSRHKAKRYKR